jgi:hypothetical protein
MKRWLWVLPFLLIGCGDEVIDPPPAPVETLEPAPAAAPSGLAGGRLSCLGHEILPAPGNSLELTGYVRALADPTASVNPPAAKVEAFATDGSPLGSAFSDIGKAGRTAVSVPIKKEEGFKGYVVVTSTGTGFLEWRFKGSRPVTSTDYSAWIWLATPDEVEAYATGASTTFDDTKGSLVGAVHDCNGFGVANTVVQVSGSTDHTLYMEGFDIEPGRTFTDASGWFVVPNLSPGTVTIKAFGRTESGGKLELLSSVDAGIEAGKLTSVGLQPRFK